MVNKLIEISDFPFSPAAPPAHWNQPSHLEHVYTQVQSLYLPEFSPLQPGMENWATVKQELRSYVGSLVGQDYGGAALKLNSRFGLFC